MMKHTLSVLGSTGSIGTQTLDVVRNLGLSVCALAARGNVRLLEEQIREFMPRFAAVFDPEAAKRLRLAVRDLDVTVAESMDGLCEAASLEEAELVCNSVVGMVGLEPTLAAVEAGKDIALANKETLVAGGALVTARAAERGVRLYPVDSEHSAIFQCLQGSPGEKAVSRLILTASGGPFFGKKRAELVNVTPEQALRHPNWSMGAKISVDSATMMNKGLEFIEAMHLFGVTPDDIQVLIHPESVVHSMVELLDGTVIAQLGVPDMGLPIQYALTYPERKPSRSDRLDLTAYPNGLHFYAPDLEALPCLALAMRCARTGGTAPTVMNAANEIAVGLFLGHKIGYHSIYESVAAAVEAIAPVAAPDLDVIRAADQEARAFVRSYFRF